MSSLACGPEPMVAADQPDARARRLAEHEHRIHNHPCGCGSGKRYVDCCIDKINQEYIELRNRRQMARRSAEGKP